MFVSNQSTTATQHQPTNNTNGDVEPLITNGDDVPNDTNVYDNLTEATEYVPGPYNDSRALDGASSHITMTLKGKWDRLNIRKNKSDMKSEHIYGIRELGQSVVMRNYTIYLSLIWYVIKLPNTMLVIYNVLLPLNVLLFNTNQPHITPYRLC